jgi:hypothetical protein
MAFEAIAYANSATRAHRLNGMRGGGPRRRRRASRTAAACQLMLTGMDDLTRTRSELSRQLDEALETDPLEALRAVGQLEQDVAAHQRKAVRAAARRHTWAEIGEALGVSRQAAHHKYAKLWARSLKSELKAEVHAQKTARARGDHAAAESAERSRDALIEELKQAAKAQRKH